MTSASSVDGDNLRINLFALVVVVALHVLFYQWLSHEGYSPPAQRAGAGELRVEFITVARPPVVVAPDEPTVPVPSDRPLARPRKPPPLSGSSAIPADASAITPQAPLVMEWTDPPDATASFRMNLPDGRPAEALAEPEPPNLRLRRQVSGEDVVEGAAQLLGFWPPGYESDPCPRVQRNIAALMTDTRDQGREQLAEELRRKGVACRQ